MAPMGLAALAVAFNAFVWGLSWWPFRALLDHGVHPLWSTALIYGFALLCVLAVRPRALRGFFRKPGLWLLGIGVGCTNVGFNWAVTEGDVVRVVLLFYLMPAWSVMLAWPLLGEKPTAASLARLALALAGVVVVLKTPGTAWPVPESRSDVLAIFGGFAFALTNILLQKLRDVPSDARGAAMFMGGAAIAGCAGLVGLAQGFVPALPPPAFAWGAIAAGLAFAFLASNLSLQYGAARLSAQGTALVMLLEVVFASASSIAAGASAMTVRVAVGGLMILVAAVWASVSASGTDRPPG